MLPFCMLLFTYLEKFLSSQMRVQNWIHFSHSLQSSTQGNCVAENWNTVRTNDHRSYAYIYEKLLSPTTERNHWHRETKSPVNTHSLQLKRYIWLFNPVELASNLQIISPQNSKRVHCSGTCVTFDPVVSIPVGRYYHWRHSLKEM